MEIKPIHITIDVNVKVDKALDDFFSDVDDTEENIDLLLEILGEKYDISVAMDGEQAFREIRRIQSDAIVILCSGYNEQEATERFAGKGLAGFLQKPYTLAVLRMKMMLSLQAGEEKIDENNR